MNYNLYGLKMDGIILILGYHFEIYNNNKL